MAASWTPAAAPPEVARFFRLLADETRVRIMRQLALTDLRAGELGEAVRLPSNALAYHLKQLRALGLVHDRRSSADARDVYYHLDADRLSQLYTAGGDCLYPGLTVAAGNSGIPAREAGAPPLRVLFLCTHNSARSQLAEGILNKMGRDHVEAFSAGSEPTAVDPDAVAVLREWGIDPTNHRAKALATFSGQLFDYVITVCDRVREVCPVFPGDPIPIHWSLADPAVIEESDRRLEAFRALALELRTRIRRLLLLSRPATGQREHPHHQGDILRWQ
jgi:protein-tyrosine-phosphatase/DNA-binding transcriptional ArsR family regulator